MKKIALIFTFLLALSFSAFAQTVTWNSAHPAPLYATPANMQIGTNTYAGGQNSGSIIITTLIEDCNFSTITSGCSGGDLTSELPRDYTLAPNLGALLRTRFEYSLVFYDVAGGLINASVTRSLHSEVNRCPTGFFTYETFSWTTAPGTPPIAYVEEQITQIEIHLYQDPNGECYAMRLDDGNPETSYPLGSPFSGVLLGPLNNPLAIGTTDNDDYTNKSFLGNVVGTTTVTSQIISFQNTVRNKDTVTDSAVITAPTVPSGFVVEASANCSTYTTISSGGNITISNIPATSNVTFCVRITAPSGIATFTPFSTILRATSVNDPIKTNDTIDRIYTGYVVTTKSGSVVNSTGVGSATDPVPGARINYAVNYQNIANLPFGTGNYDLIATNLVITEDGSQLPNNWATFTNHVAGSAADTMGGTITGDVAGSNLLTDTIPSLAPGQSGVFSFSRIIK